MQIVDYGKYKFITYCNQLFCMQCMYNKHRADIIFYNVQLYNGRGYVYVSRPMNVHIACGLCVRTLTYTLTLRTLTYAYENFRKL
jgi:hypothetical protein